MRTLSLALLAVAAASLAPASARAQGAMPGTAWREMTECAALGSKGPGSAANRELADHIEARFRAAGLETSVESFHLPVWQPEAATLRIAGGPEVYAESFPYSGTGTVESEVVDVGAGRPNDYNGVDVRGKVVMVRRDDTYHRTVQVKQVAARGGVAMLYVSTSPENLIQTGAVSWGNSPPASIPAVTVGARDGAALRGRMADGPLRVAIEVEAERVDAVGRNILGVRRGTVHPDRYVVIAGHYDSWHVGAVDNCSAIGSLLEILDATKDISPAYTIIYGAWDAEEPGLLGSYDWLRRHPDIVARTVLNQNLEMTSAATYVNGQRLDTNLLHLAGTTAAPALSAVIATAAAQNAFNPIFGPIGAYRQVSGGIIPTDLEGFYAAGVQGFTTASLTPYYHTVKESPDKLDPESLQRVTAFLTDVLVDVQSVPPEHLMLREVPTVKVSAPEKAAAGAPATVDIEVTDPVGRPVEGGPVTVLANQRGHWAVAESRARELGDGRYRWRLPAGVTDADVTHLRATLATPTALAVGFATIDQRRGGLLRRASPCRSRRVITMRVRDLRRGERIVRLRARASAGRVRILKRRGHRVRLDLRGVPRRVVRVRLVARTNRGRTLRQTRIFRTCARAGSLAHAGH